MPSFSGPSANSTSPSRASSAIPKKERTRGMADPLHSEFCPRCGTPVDTSGDESPLCDACGWFGDNTETARTPPDTGQFSPVLAVVQALTLFRDVCRQELMAEQICASTAPRKPTCVRSRPRPATPCTRWWSCLRPCAGRTLPTTVLPRVNGLVPWPDEWSDRHYNACTEPCDILVGPCACGAWHDETENWVRETLQRHNAVIR